MDQTPSDQTPSDQTPSDQTWTSTLIRIRQAVAWTCFAVVLVACAPRNDGHTASSSPSSEDTGSGSRLANSPPPPPPIRLVLQITVDQLRGDLPARILDRVEPGGLRDLYDRGVQFTNAHYDHANTETIVGHATLATGAPPSVHGMIGNVWLDRSSGQLTYNVEDPAYPLLNEGEGVDAKTEIDPTQKVARSQGRSPAALRGSTFCDELTFATRGRAKVFAVSVKDRGAIALAGHTGKALWFSKSTGTFVSSRYYFEDEPDWLSRFNAQERPARYAQQPWTLSKPLDSYFARDADDRPWEVALPGYGRVFPHDYGTADNKLFTTLLTLSPAGDELTEEIAEIILEAEALGQDDVPDYLSVSLSSTDYVGHVFGPDSLEAEDNLFRLDRTVARLLARVDETVGLEHTIVVLSADHGAPDAPGALAKMGMRAAAVDPHAWDKAPAVAALGKTFGVRKPLVRKYFHPYVYLDRELIARKGLDLGNVAAAVATKLETFDGVAAAVSSLDAAAGRLADTPLHRAILNNYDPERSGDVFVVLEPFRVISEMDGLTVASHHGSPWSYDTFVPIVVAGPGISPRTVHRLVRPTAIATTLSALLGIKPPSGARGDILREVLTQTP